MEYNNIMARTPTTFDVFNAIAEPKRRELMNLLRSGARTVNAIAEMLGWRQPQVSKHLAVLHRVGLVQSEARGREHYYHLDAAGLREIHEWTATFEEFWKHQLVRIKERAEEKARMAKRRD